MTSKQTTLAPRRFGPDVRETFLALIRAGHGRHSACRAVEVSPDTFRRFYRASEDFRVAVADAEEEAAEPVEAKLYAAALAGEPWAVTKWLQHRLAARWGETTRKLDVSVDVTGVIGVAPVDGAGLARVVGRVEALAAELEARRAALVENGETPALMAGASLDDDVVDAEVVG